MNKKELIKSVLRGEKPASVPYAMWSHMPAYDRDPVLIAQKTYEFYKEYDVDIVKTMNNGMYSVEDYGCEIDYSEVAAGGVAKIVNTPVNSGKDFKKIQAISIDSEALKREQTYLALILDKLKGEEVPVLFTVFSPVTTANKLCGNKLVEYIEAGYGKEIHAALDKITETTCRLVEQVVSMGADGIFLASQMSSYAVSDESFYREYGVPYDKRVCSASKGWCNALHAHGDDIMFDLLKDYPVQIFNWHVWQSLPTVDEALAFTDKILLGGIERFDITENNRNKLRHEIFETIRATGGKRLILAPGCVIRYPLDKENLAYVRQVKLEVEEALFGDR